jgi:hypothetical protein
MSDFYLDKSKMTNKWAVVNRLCGHVWNISNNKNIYALHPCCKDIPENLCDKRDMLNKIMEY